MIRTFLVAATSLALVPPSITLPLEDEVSDIVSWTMEFLKFHLDNEIFLISGVYSHTIFDFKALVFTTTYVLSKREHNLGQISYTHSLL